MPQSCAICRKPFIKENGSSFRVPLSEERRNRWNVACSKIFSKSARVCHKHFHKTDFINPPEDNYGPLRLQPGAVPSLVFPEIAEFGPMPDIVQPNGEVIPATSISLSTQTEDDAGCSYRMEIYTLKEENKALKAENEKLLQENNKFKASFSSIFTEGQVKKLMNPDMKIMWTRKDISNAICCHAAGPRAYQHYYAKGFPLPHSKTLQAWARKLNVDEGILSFSVECLKSQKNFPTDDKICVISFDEMKVHEVFEHDPLTDTVKQPSEYVQMAIVRGLKASWKQPIYAGFDTKMTKKLINQIISAIHEASFPVVAIVSDMSPANQAFWTELQVSREKPWFQHPVDTSHKVFVFADVPHCLKLIRNHFLDTGLLIDGQIITSQTIKQVMANATELDILNVFKLTDEHITVQQSGRQNVEFAKELFSNTTAAAIRRCHELDMEINLPLVASDFIKLVNDWFDIHNAKMGTFNLPGKRPFGLELTYQIGILERMDAIMERPILPGENGIAPFQKGILISNMALRMLHEYVSEIYGLSYVLTYRCNLDIIEKFFNIMRSKGGQNDLPTPMQYKSRLRQYMLAPPSPERPSNSASTSTSAMAALSTPSQYTNKYNDDFLDIDCGDIN